MDTALPDAQPNASSCNPWRFRNVYTIIINIIITAYVLHIWLFDPNITETVDVHMKLDMHCHNSAEKHQVRIESMKLVLLWKELQKLFHYHW